MKKFYAFNKNLSMIKNSQNEEIDKVLADDQPEKSILAVRDNLNKIQGGDFEAESQQLKSFDRKIINEDK